MPRYFFDIDDGEAATGDDEGIVYETADAARKAAVKTLAQIAEECLPDGANRDFSVTMWSETGEPVFEALMAFKSGWVGGHQ